MHKGTRARLSKAHKNRLHVAVVRIYKREREAAGLSNVMQTDTQQANENIF